ncbi:MAG: UDP-N-acetylmuramoyl-L-alanine--D-glutamate ligase [Candidatus Omnitrophica bacterium]|nr:UDP-N-acetylmuramoyl-L-alanine--D-glutamate ligase [Candidatus Omnitrophota bacterium]
MEIKGKSVTIIGAGRSGQAAARLVATLEGRVKVSESVTLHQVDPSFQKWLQENDGALESGGHTQVFIEESDLVVVSPGVRRDAECLRWAEAKGIPVIGEVELAAQFCPCPIIAVTGSNGKTTVVTLITAVLRLAGRAVHSCGNIGNPFSDYVLKAKKEDFVVLEVSSFQMETVKEFRPHVGVLLNFSQNHLDRHADLDEYFDMKKRIFARQTEEDHAVLNKDDERIRGLADELGAQVTFFSQKEECGAAQTAAHNANFLVVTRVAGLLGIGPDACKEVFAQFQGVEHRLEKVRTFKGVDYINDSKSTTGESGRWALNNVQRPAIMICGGRDKNIDFSSLKEIVEKKVKRMIVIGEAREKLKETFQSVVEVEECDQLKEAVQRSQQLVQDGDCVLFSPMCASFDMFRNYEERGRAFKKIVQQLN